MRFAYPWVLLLLVPAAAGVWALYGYAQRLARRKLAFFTPASRLENVVRSVNYRARRWKAVLFGVALALLIVAAARPMWGPRKDSTSQKGSEFFIVLDVSKSMLVRDVKPNRLEAVKASLSEWLKSRTGDRIGLILMAGDAFVQAPLTNDYTALREVLGQSNPYSISKGGTNIPFAVQTAVKALEVGEVKHKAVVIISDGENLEGQTVQDIEKAHTSNKVTFFTIGVGTSEGGPVPEKELKPDFAKPPRVFVKDEYGVTAHSRLDERSLRAIATAGGGRYFPFVPEGEVWNTLYTQALAPLAARTDSFSPEDYADLFQIPLGLALLLLALEVSLSTRHKNPGRPRSIETLPERAEAPIATAMPSAVLPTLPPKRRSPVVAALLLFGCGAATVSGALSPAGELIRQSESMVKAGKAAEAAELLRAAAQKAPDDFFLVYNGGIASYAAGKYQDAIESFTEASSAPDEKIRALALMQIGNAEFQLSKTLLKGVNRVGAAVALEHAVETYQSALTVKSSSAAEHNLQVARESLETVLMSLGASYHSNAQKTEKTEAKVAELTKAVTSFERVTQIDEKSAEARQKLAETRKELAEQLRNQARDLATKAEALDPAKEKEQKEAEKLNVKANESYQQARDQAPQDKALAKEHDEFRQKTAEKLAAQAEQKMQQAMQPEAKTAQGEAKKQEQGLTEAVAKADQALAFDDQNKKAQEVKAQATQKLEQAKVAQGDALKASGEKDAAAAKPEAAASALSEAMQKFQGALEINPQNAHAKSQLAQTQEALAKALAESGKKEMAQAANPGAEPPKKRGKAAAKAEPKTEGQGEKPDAGAPGQGEPEKSASELRQQIGHMEKAAQSFAQAEALQPGQNDAANLQAQALEQLANLRADLDQKQNKPPGAGQPKPAGEQAGPPAGDQPPAPGEQPGQTPAKMASQSPTKPVLNFSDLRGGTPGEGQFKDLRQKTKVRDW